jgi:hypothetical protein
MATSERFGPSFDPLNVPRWGQVAERRLGPLVESAGQWAREAGKRLAVARRWVENEAMVKQPITTLSVALGLGVITGWLIKRR